MDHGDRWTAIGLDEVERVDWRGTGITWRPIRAALGADIVGMAVFTAERAGAIVIEPHTEIEDGRGQQEVYVVIRGAARFVIDGEGLRAEAGTFVRVEPAAHREAVALEGDTAVLALGGDTAVLALGGESLVDRLGQVKPNDQRAGGGRAARRTLRGT